MASFQFKNDDVVKECLCLHKITAYLYILCMLVLH